MYDRIAKIKRSKFYIPETILGLMILLAINLYFFPSKPAFEGVNPNPLWIIVLAIAARYGRNGALLASALTSTFFVTYYILTYSVEIFYDDLWLLRFPFFFMLVGFLIGEVKTVFILREDYLTRRVEELEHMNDELTKENEIVKEAHKDLTIDVATTQDTITILNEITAKLKSTNPEEIFKGVLDGFREHLGAEECSYYSLEGNLLVLKMSEGWKDYYRRPDSYKIGEGMVGLVAEKKEPLSIKDFVLKKHRSNLGEMDIMGDSILAVPVLGLENKLYGVASIEKIPLLKLTDSTIQAARITCELAASSLNNAYSFLNIKEKQIKDEHGNLYKYHYFLTRFEEEYLRSLNYMIPLSVMTFNWPNISREGDEKQVAAFDALTKLIDSNLRTFDVLAKGPTKETPLVLLLATTSVGQANNLKEKLINKIHEYKFEKIIGEKSLEKTITIVDFNPNKYKNSAEMLKVVRL